ncbi:hypothetical protein [Salmonirosea aquatica]|uniref:Uncharacterized protein n=1 Tax=Salmonirosea aquatica TaxID=2654236 RepID=A0A7C9BGY4_9BACT|nr:hypothetical protein [Cytophagaceae bacterium SJW1-29]
MKQSLKQGVAVGFLLLLCIKAWVMPLLYLDFELRKEFIIDNFCVNKDRPELHCDGKCYLAIRLAAVQKQEQQQAERNFMFKLLENITDCQTFFASFSAPDYAFDEQVPSSFYYVSSFFPNASLSGVFHPPQLG